MLKNFQASLFFSFLICLALYGSAFAQDENNISETPRSSWTTPITKDQIVEGFNNGIQEGATHMLIVWDTWDLESSYNFIVYSFPEEDVNDLIKYYDTPGFYRVASVLATHLDLDQQLNDKRWYPEYP